jgi:hypothetical protein
MGSGEPCKAGYHLLNCSMGFPARLGWLAGRGGVGPPRGGAARGAGGPVGGAPSEQAYLCRRRIIAAIHLARSQGKRRTCATWSNVGRILLQVAYTVPLDTVPRLVEIPTDNKYSSGEIILQWLWGRGGCCNSGGFPWSGGVYPVYLSTIPPLYLPGPYASGGREGGEGSTGSCDVYTPLQGGGGRVPLLLPGLRWREGGPPAYPPPLPLLVHIPPATTPPRTPPPGTAPYKKESQDLTTESLTQLSPRPHAALPSAAPLWRPGAGSPEARWAYLEAQCCPSSMGRDPHSEVALSLQASPLARLLPVSTLSSLYR